MRINGKLRVSLNVWTGINVDVRPVHGFCVREDRIGMSVDRMSTSIDTVSMSIDGVLDVWRGYGRKRSRVERVICA